MSCYKGACENWTKRDNLLQTSINRYKPRAPMIPDKRSLTSLNALMNFSEKLLTIVKLCLLLSATLIQSFNYRILSRRDSSYHTLCGRSYQQQSPLLPLFSVSVFDNVLDGLTCSIVDHQVKLGGLGHTVFVRESPPRTSIESVIHSILLSINDSSPMVEYWWREEWMNLEMHRDVDEKLAMDQGPIRFPEHAHVLYLSVGVEVFGPTVVFHDGRGSSRGAFDEVTIVPALTGRLLRFNGDMMHAVPRPALAYFDPSVGGTNTELWTRRRPLDDNDPELSVFRRSVLLFNTWMDSPPHDISLQPPSRSLDAHSKWREDNMNSVEKCQPKIYWSEVKAASTANKNALDKDGGKSSVRLKIGLLGDIRRRERTDRYINVYAPAAIKDSFVGTERGKATFLLSDTETPT